MCPMGFKITDEHSSPREVQIRNAHEFVKCLGLGQTPEEAALAVGTPLKKLMRSPEVLELIEDLRDYHFEKAEDRKAIVLARNMKIVMTGEDRDATAASRIVTSDPALGFHEGGPTINITISPDVEKLDAGHPWEDEEGK